MALVLILSLASCTTAQAPGDGVGEPSGGARPPLPEKIQTGEGEEPTVKVYVTDDAAVKSMPIEEYLAGVLAGEMKNDWPLEALKAQAILARTFTLRFMTEKESKYEGADVSTDIEEAQAYDADGVNDRILQAIEETRGLALTYNGEFPYSWFFAHSGGKTALAKEGLEYAEDEPGYTQVVEGRDSEDAPEEAKAWTAQFSPEQVMDAANAEGELQTIEIGERGESGRATTILINDQPYPAASLRIALGSTEMRSTLLDEIRLEDGTVIISGKGYGHGVGMPQWGAYSMAEEGSEAEEILKYYFKDVAIEKMW
jgi:stage II sporulation protein D